MGPSGESAVTSLRRHTMWVKYSGIKFKYTIKPNLWKLIDEKRGNQSVLRGELKGKEPIYHSMYHMMK